MKLRIEHGTIGHLTVPLEARGVVLGREGGRVDVELNWDRRVSRRHVRFWIEGRTVWFEDLGSHNGTWLAEQRISGPQRLREGATLTIGDTTVTLSTGAEAEGAITMGDLEKAFTASALDLPLGEDTVAFHALSELGTGELLVGVFDAPPVDEPGRTPSAGSGPPPVIVPPPAKAPPVVVPPAIVPQAIVPQAIVPQAIVPQAVAPPPPEAPAPAPAKKEAFVRVHPRFTTDKKVSVRIGDRSELKELWLDNISKGGLFVCTEHPPSRGARVEVVINTPEGDLELEGEVVHVVDTLLAESMRTPAGVGLAFVNLTHAKKEAIHRYVDGLAARLDGGTPGVAPAPQPVVATAAQSDPAIKAAAEAALARARDLISQVESNAVYGALQVKPTAPLADLTARIAELRAMFAKVEPSATPPQLARISGAQKLLDRAATLMSNPDRRMEYDFRHGEVRADERMSLARQQKGPSITELRGVWHRAMPDRLDKALVLVKEAIAAKKDRDLVRAIRLGRAALELDPFHEELRRTVDAWAAQEGGPPRKDDGKT
ncbi:FHA domain-containing protein [Myxococcota bacterium]|nr:FHA domain-containing protein [Myxococcota bacterium]